MARVQVFNDPDIDRGVVKATGVTLAESSAAGDGSLPSEATEGTTAPNHPAVEPKQAETVGPSEARGLVEATGGTLDVETKQAENFRPLEATEGVSAAPKPAGRTRQKMLLN
jgi:hypothetical protein